MKKNIAIIHGQMVIGGAERVLVNMLHHFDYERYNISLFLDKPIQSEEDGLEHLIDKRVSIAYWDKIDFSVGSPFLSSQVFDCAISYQGLNCIHLDLLINHIKAKRKVAWMHGDCRYEITEPRKTEFLDKYVRLDQIFCVSKGVEKIFLNVFPQLSNLTAVLYNLLDDEEIIVKSSFLVEDPLEGSFTILSVGRISKEKGHVLIPKAARLLKDEGRDFKWYIIGDGDCRKDVEEEIAKWQVDDCVVIKGYRQNPYPYIKGCDLFVLPSFSEGYCTVTMEALLLKKCIVATPVCGVDEQIDDGRTGLIAKETTSEALFKAVRKLLFDRSFREQIEDNLSMGNFNNATELQKLYNFVEAEKPRKEETGLKFSIVLPVYNVEKYLRQALESVINQIYRNIEIVCVNDGSTDNSLSILEDYAGFDDRIKIINQENEGLFVARKNGILASTGDYVLCMDSDDWLDLDACASFASKIAECPDTDILQYGVLLEGADKSMKPLDKRLNVMTTAIQGNDQMLRLCYDEKVIPWNIASKIIRGDIARKAYSQMKDVRFGYLEDFIGNFYVMALSHSWCHIDRRFYHYRMLAGMTAIKKSTIEDFTRSLGYLEAFRYLCDWVEKNYEDNQRILEVLHKSTFNYVFDEPFAYIHNRMDTAQVPDSYSLLISQRLGAEATLLGFSRRLRVRESQNLTRIVRAEKKLRKYRALTKWLAVLSGLLLLVVVLLLLCVIF